MTKTLLFAIFLFFNSCIAYALSEQPEKLTFLDGKKEVAYTNKKGNHTFMILRPLNEFNIGEKYCLHGKHWDAECQDAAMYYAYGKHWREFKSVVLEFLKAYGSDNRARIRKLCYYPLNFIVATRMHSDGGIGYRLDIIENEENFPWTGDGYEERSEDEYQNICIKDFFHDLDLPSYTLELPNKMNIGFKVKCELEPNQNCHYIPRIAHIRY